MVRTYVTPSKGFKTSKAFAAFLYCCVSKVFADRSFVMRTHIMAIRNTRLSKSTTIVGAWCIQSIVCGFIHGQCFHKFNAIASSFKRDLNLNNQIQLIYFLRHYWCRCWIVTNVSLRPILLLLLPELLYLTCFYFWVHFFKYNYFFLPHPKQRYTRNLKFSLVSVFTTRM